MILPILGYGDPVLRKIGEDIAQDYPNFKELLTNMYETMYNACGVGLAAPQVNVPLQIFIVSKRVMSTGKNRPLNSVKLCNTCRLKSLRSST